MADNPNTPVTGFKVASDEVTYSGDTAQTQLMRPVHVTGAEGSKVVHEATGLPGASSAAAVTVQGVASGTPIPISGSVTATGSLTDAQLRATAVPVSGPLTDVQLRATAVPVSGTVAATGPLTDTELRATAVPVSLASVPAHGVTGPLTDTELRLTAVPVSLASVPSHAVTGPLTDAQLRATAVPVSGTVAVTGTLTDAELRATAVPVSSASLPLPTGASTETTLGTRLSETDFDSKAGSLTEAAPGTDTASSGLNGRLQRIAQRITSLIALLPAALIGGRLDVNIGASPNTLNVSDQPATSGGCSTYHVISAASTNTANIKASAGQVFGIDVFNNAGYPIFVKLHNTAGTPTAGSGIVRTFGVQAGTRGGRPFPKGLAFATGIGISIVKLIADADATVLVAGDCSVDVEWK